MFSNLDEANEIVRGWAYDPSIPGVAPEIAIYINERLVGTYQSNDPRPDLSAVHPGAQYGFLVDISGSLSEGPNEIVVKHVETGQELINGRVRYMAGAKYKVAHGLRDFLFLINDSNNAVQQIEGKLGISAECATSLVNTQIRLCQDFSHEGIMYHCSIVPDKYVVYSDCATNISSVSEERSASRIVSACRQLNTRVISYPVEVLLAMRAFNDVFYRTDTHLSPFGTLCCTGALLSHINIYVPLLSRFQTMETERLGDLGNKLSPPLSEWANSFQPIDQPDILTNSVECALQNRTQITGSSIIFRSKNSFFPNKKCILFGTSHGPLICEFLSAVFGTVVFVWSVNLDHNLINRMKPDFVYRIVTERFIRAKFEDHSFSVPNADGLVNLIDR